jgi:hypothetical protein
MEQFKKETRLEIIKRLSETGEIISLYKAGLIEPFAIKYRNIYFDVNAFQKIGQTRMDAIYNAAAKYNCGIQTIYRAIKWIDEK